MNCFFNKPYKMKLWNSTPSVDKKTIFTKNILGLCRAKIFWISYFPNRLEKLNVLIKLFFEINWITRWNKLNFMRITIFRSRIISCPPNCNLKFTIWSEFLDYKNQIGRNSNGLHKKLNMVTYRAYNSSFWWA